MMRRLNVFVLMLLALAIPAATFYGLPRVRPLRTLDELDPQVGSRYPVSQIAFERRELGPPVEQRPLITNVQVLDFDNDGRTDVLACDARRQCLVLLRQSAANIWSEQVLAADLAAPAHATVVDLDGDGDRDVLVSLLGDLFPNDGVIGQLIWLEQTPQGFTRHVLLDDVRRVADCRAGDFDEDGDLDLVVAAFGYARGQVLWLENLGEGRFLDHELLAAPGTIHVPVADYDGDGDLDIAAIVSQEDEELWGFENVGHGEFRPRRLWFTINDALGSAGLVEDDLDGDGDIDLILPAGDNLEVLSAPQRGHGCLWFENKGDWNFAEHRISSLGATYAAAVGDLDADGDRDVVLVSMFNNWGDARNASVVWLENDGQQQFRTWQIDTEPTHRVTVALGDLDGDGRLDVVTGGLHLAGPFDKLGAVTAWFNRGGHAPP